MTRQWVWLMVGGPWHGTWLKLEHQDSPHQRPGTPKEFRVLDPLRLPTYEREPEFGVIGNPSPRTTWYIRMQFQTGRRWTRYGPEVWIEALVVSLGRPGEDLNAMVAEAFELACYKPEHTTLAVGG